MSVFIVFTVFAWNISRSKQNWERSNWKLISVFTTSSRYYCQILMKFKFSRQILEKIIKYKISRKSVQWEPSCSMQTDRRDEANNRFSKLRERA